MEDMFNTLIKLVEGQWSLNEDYVWYKVGTGTHKYDYEKQMVILVKEGLL